MADDLPNFGDEGGELPNFGAGKPTGVLPSVFGPIGKGFQKAGRAFKDVLGAYAFEALGEPELQAQQLGIKPETLQKAGFTPEVLPEGETPLVAGTRQLPVVPRVISKAGQGLVESVPQLAAVAAGQAVGIPAPLSAAVVFGSTPEGLNIKQAAIAAALPYIGKYSGALGETIASKLGVTKDQVLNIINKLGGATGAAAVIGADQLYEISKLPEDQKQNAYEDALANVVSQAGLGMMGGREPKKGVPDAQTIRRDQEVLPQTGQVPEGSQKVSGDDLQQPPPRPPDVPARPGSPPSAGVNALEPTVESVTPLEPQSGTPILPTSKTRFEVGGKEVTPEQIEQMRAGIPIPGIDKFVQQDVRPLLQRGVDAVKAAKDIVLKLVAPVTRAEPKDVDVLFESKGYKDELLFKANAALEGARKQMGALPLEEQVAFIDRVKRGQPQPTPELQQTADLLRTWDDKLFNEVKKYRPDLPYLENHLRVLWKVIPGSAEAQAAMAKAGLSKEQIMGRRPWQGSKGFLKKHTLEDISEGIAQGGVPVSFNPVELFSLHAQDAMKFVAANRAWEGLKKTGAVEFVRRGDAPPEGYTRINDGIARVYFKTDKGLVSPGEWWVEPNAARLINNYLSRDWIRGNALGRGLMDLKNATTAIELGLSPFHAVFETNETIGSSLGLGLAKMFSGKFSEGAKDIVGSLASPKQTAKLGGAAIRFAKDPAEFQKAFPDAYNWFIKKYPNAQELIKDLFLGGGKLEMHEDYRVRAAERLDEAIKTDNYVGAVARFLPALNRTVMKPLFETYIPRLKVGMFLRDYAFELERRQADLQSGKISRGELARKTWEFIDDRFGELNWDNLFWDRTFKSGMQLLFRSVTWKLGNIRGFGKAGVDTVKELGRDWWKEGRAPRMTLPMGWFVGMSIVTAAQASILTKVTTGKYPWELASDVGELVRNLTFPRIDLKDASQRVSIPTYWRDMVHLKHSPVDYVRSSMTGEIGRLADIWQNKDFYGTQVYNPDDPLYRKGLDAFEHMVPLPFGAQSFIAAQRTGETKLKSGLGFAGFTKAPYYMSHSPAEQTAMEELRRRVPQGARTKESYDKSIQERKVIQAIKRGETTLRGAVADGLIDPRRAKTINTKLRETPLQYGVTHLDPVGAIRVWEKANPKERAEIEPLVRRKIIRSNTLSKEEKQQYLTRMQGEPVTPAEPNPFQQ